LEPLEQIQKPLSARPSYNEHAISIEEFKKFLDESKETSKNRKKAPKYTSKRRQTLTIGDGSMMSSPRRTELRLEASLKMIAGNPSDSEEKPVSWRTSFDIDAPREPLTDVKPLSPSLSLDSYVRKDEWASIDSILLDNSSVDASVAYSTSDILPSDTVTAMRNDDGNQKNKESQLYKESLTSIPKLPSRSSIEKRQTKDGKRSFRRSRSNGSHIFEMFNWSTKENVDEEQESKRILNQRPRPLGNHISWTRTKMPSDHPSMPGLQDFTTHTNDQGSAVSSSTCGESSFAEEGKLEDEEMISAGSGPSHVDKNRPVQNSGTNECIRSIQDKLTSLPTIVEDNHPSFPNSSAAMSALASVKQRSLAEEESNPTCVTESSQLDELPSTSSLSLNTSQKLPDDGSNDNHNSRRGRKKKKTAGRK
jgi:hypothetical protein